MNTFVADCNQVAASIDAFAGGSLSADDFAAIDGHLLTCKACRERVKRYRAVKGALEYVEQQERRAEYALALPVETQPAPSAWHVRLSTAPWWFVSLTLHVLVIALAGLVSMAIELPKADDSVIMVTELQSRPVAAPEEKKENPTSALESAHDTPATDPTSKDASNIVVPPDLLAKAELSDHFETINPDLPGNHSALGNPDAQSFHSVTGNTEAAGGGGNSGMGMEDVIGVGGAASRGSGGGFGGGDGTGVGTGSGAGKGSFGQRLGGGRKLMVKRNGGSKETEGAVNAALRWLAYHQEPDGHWDTVKYGGGSGWNGPAGLNYDIALTGLSVLAFLGAGHTEKVGEWKDNVVRAVGWLKSVQSDDGGIKASLPKGSGNGYDHAILTMALSEAAGMARVPETRAAAQRAVDYCTEIHQQGDASEKGAWRYGKKEAPDISVSGWFVMALKSAKVSGLHVNPAAFEGAMKFLDKVETKLPAADGIDPAYGPVMNYRYRVEQETDNAQTTAIGVLCRQFMGYKKDDLQNSVEWFVKKGGVPKVGNFAMYYCYYSTLVTFQQGGDIWTRWNEAMKPALVNSQEKAGDNAGSWSQNGDPYYPWWGRVGATALCALSLEVYYRYQKLNQ